MPGRAAHLPDAQVRLAPVLQRRFHLAAHHRPHPLVQPLPAAQLEVDGLQHGAPDVVLALGIGLVPHPHRPRPVVPAEVVEDPLGEHALAVHPVDHLDLVVTLGEVGEEPEEIIRLPVEAQRVQAPQGERGVAQPAVAVVPVALPARDLRQRRGGRGDHGAARRERQALQRQRAALQVAAPRMVRETAPGQPVLPVVRGPDQPLACLLVGERRRVIGPGQGTEMDLTLPHPGPGHGPAALEPEPQVGGQGQRDPLGVAGRVAGRLRVGAVGVGPGPLVRGRSRRPARTRT